MTLSFSSQVAQYQNDFRERETRKQLARALEIAKLIYQYQLERQESVQPQYWQWILVVTNPICFN